MNVLNIKLDSGAYMPERAHKYDAGLDLKTPKDVCLKAGSFVEIDTGVHVQIPQGKVGLLKSKSGLNVRNHIIGEGVIDSGYGGSIRVKLYNMGYLDYVFKRGDKIIQLLILDVDLPTVNVVERIVSGARGDNGFGSTGR